MRPGHQTSKGLREELLRVRHESRRQWRRLQHNRRERRPQSRRGAGGRWLKFDTNGTSPHPRALEPKLNVPSQLRQLLVDLLVRDNEPANLDGTRGAIPLEQSNPELTVPGSEVPNVVSSSTRNERRGGHSVRPGDARVGLQRQPERASWRRGCGRLRHRCGASCKNKKAGKHRR
jgi:hypothetical protein